MAAHSLRELLADLHRRRVVVLSPRELERVERLLRSRPGWDPDELAEALAALLATNPEQWGAVRAAAREALGATLAATTLSREGAPPPRIVLEVEEPASRRDRLLGWLRRLAGRARSRALGLHGAVWTLGFGLGLVLGALGALVLLRVVIPENRAVVVAEPPLPDPPALASVPPGAQPPRLALEQRPRPTTAEVEGELGPGGWLALVVLSGLSAGLVVVGSRWLSLPDRVAETRREQSRARLDTREQMAALGPGLGRVYRVERFPALPVSAIDDAGAILSRRRPAGLSDDLDIPAILHRAVRDGGRVVLLRAPGARAPELLVLLDVEAGDHPFLDAAEQVIARWVQTGVRLLVHRYNWRWDPAALDRLARRTEGMPLLLVSRLARPEGMSRGARPWMLKLRAWPARAFLDLDPRPPEERDLAGQLALSELTRAGLPRYPFSGEGLLAVAAALTGGAPPGRPPSPEPLPPLDAVEDALRLWATTAAFVPDPSWAQLEAIRRHFPELRARLPEARCVARLLEWVAREGRAHGLRGEPLRDNGRKLALPDGLADALTRDCRASDLARFPDDLDRRLEVRARRLLVEQLRGSSPETPLEQAERHMKLALHEAILDRAKVEALLEELRDNPLSPELAAALRTELELQREGLTVRGGFRRADVEILSDTVHARPVPRVPARAVAWPPRAIHASAYLPATVAVALSWLSWSGWTWSREKRIEIDGGVLIPASWRIDLGAQSAEPLGDSPTPALARSPSPMRFLRLRGGTFRMGSLREPMAYPDEMPAHEVTVGPFEIGFTEVTQEQWELVMGRNPSDCDHGCNPNLPVQNVSWMDAIGFLNRLSTREGQSPCYLVSGESVRSSPLCTGYRLPTEAEWEYAARAGTSTPWSWGADSSGADGHAWFIRNAGRLTQPVARKAPNPWGLYDVHGNVWEWVWDWRAAYPSEAVVDAGGPRDGQLRALRGGSFEDDPRLLRSAYRSGHGPTGRGPSIGLRVARAARGDPAQR